MSTPKTYFFCGIGGSGMMPLAVLLKKRGNKVVGSDRSFDQGKTPEKFEALVDIGIKLFPQDGSGVSKNIDVFVVSTAIEETILDVKAAIDCNLSIIKRGALLAECFNAAHQRIAIAGTSGKSTVTGMVGTVLTSLNFDPTVVNGGEIVNFKSSDQDRFASIRHGSSDIFVAEMDESDGSIEHYIPTTAILNNIALDHKTIKELEVLFGDYLGRTTKSIVANFGQPRVKKLCEERGGKNIISYGIDDDLVDLRASDLVLKAAGIDYTLHYQGQGYLVQLNVPGRHNVENSLACLGACVAEGVDLLQAVNALPDFKGIHRRMELIGKKNDITVLDDFAHNPDKISASLQTLKSFDGRLIILFQPHGFGPLRLMGKEMIAAFSSYLDEDDVLAMPEVYYAGGTVDRSVTAKDIIAQSKQAGVNAYWFERRDQIADFILDIAEEGDRIVVMGARDDTLHTFAKTLLDHLP